MELSLGSLLQLGVLSVKSPKAAARSLLNLQLSRQAIWIAFAISIIPTVLVSQIAFRFLPAELQAYWGDAMARPIQTAIQQGVFWLLVTVALHRFGRWGSRRGTFYETLLIVAWWQIIFVGFQLAQVVVYLVLLIYVPLGEVLGIAGLALVFWCLTQFIVELHGLKSGWLALLGVILSLLFAAITLIFALVTILSLLGQGGVVNV